METDGRPVEDGQHLLEVVLDTGYLSVSNVSSLLRTLQAALRAAARASDPSHDLFAEPPYPALRVWAMPEEDRLVLRLAFFDPLEADPLESLCKMAFTLFLDRLIELIKRLPQRGLWGESVAGAQTTTDDSEVTRRLDRLRIEIRRLGRVRVGFAGRWVVFESDRVELG